MAYTIKVKNDQSDGKKIQVYHHEDTVQCGANKVCELDAAGPDSEKTFSLSSEDDYLEIQFVNTAQTKNIKHYIMLPEHPVYRFFPNGDYTPGIEVYNRDGRTKLQIYEGQLLKWTLKIWMPVDHISLTTPNDNVTVRETGG